MFVQRLNIQNGIIHISGDGLHQGQVGIQASFFVDARSVFNSNDELKIIKSPSKDSCYMQVINNYDGTWIVNYTPNKIGEMHIDIFLGDKRINNSPYQVNIFDINQIHVSNLNDGFLGHLVEFNIDASKAGIGQLDIIIQDGLIPCHAIPRGSSRFDATFLPQEYGRYKIDVRFNGLSIPGSPFSCYISDISRVIVSNNLTNVHVGHPLSFDIHNQSVSLDINITAPSGRSVPFERSQFDETNTHIDYTLHEIGLHRVDVRSSGKMEFYGSSFSIQAYDSNRLIVSDIPHVVKFDQPVEFTIDASKAGEGQVEVAINDGLVPNQVKVLEKSKFLFSFIPLSNDPHILSIKFNGHQLFGFPKKCQVISSNDITIHGPGLSQVLLATHTWFTINTLHGSLSDLQVTIFSPTNEQINPSKLLTFNGLRVDWTPHEIGTYTIHVTFHSNPISGSPFRVKCYDPKKVIVTPPTIESVVQKSIKFLIDASRAGEGNLEIRVNHCDHNIPNQINPIGNSRFEVRFTPQKATVHYCNILFNGKLVPGSPFAVSVMDTPRVFAFGKGLGSVPINIPTSFTVLTENVSVKQLRCLIKGPKNRLISSIITKMDLNRYEVTYTPDRVGEFKIEVLYDNIPLDNSPFTSRSFDVNKIKIHDFPSSIMTGSSTSFGIDATNSGSGNLEISISRDGKNIPNYVKNQGGARFLVEFIPDQPTIHHVHIKFNGIDIPGSPAACHVFSSDFTFENYEYALINKQTSFLIKPKLNIRFNTNIHVDIIPPSGNRRKGKIERLLLDSYAIRFIPNEIGDHEIRFYEDEEKKLLMTKFICQVYDASKICVSDLPSAVIHRPYKFTISTTEAGNGLLSVRIKQNGNKISHEQTRISAHIYEISFIPEISNECTVQISFNEEDNFRTLVIPVTIDCEHVRVSSIPSGIVGQPIRFTLDVSDENLLSILITESHGGRVVPHTMISTLNDKKSYQISFTPNIARQHTVSISYDGKLVSTYHVDVSNSNVNKIRVSAINDGIVGIPLIFSVDTHGAGEGHLEVTINDGQRTLPAELKSVQARKFDIAFLPETSGKHAIVIAFNGNPVEGSPFIFNICDPSTSDKSTTKEDIDEHGFLIGGQLEGTKVGEIAWLICETPLTDIFEDFNVFVTDPDHIVIKHTRVQDSGGRWRIEFEPTKTGIYQIQTNIDELETIVGSMDVLPMDYKRNIYGERIVHPNVLNFVIINSNDENIKIQLRCSNGDEISTKIEREALEWKVYFTLTETVSYQLSITTDNAEQLFDIHCLVEETDIFRNGGIEDITRLIVHHSKIITDDVNVIVKDPLAHTIPAAFYRNFNRDLIVEYMPVRTDIHEVFIRTKNNLLDMCPIRIMAFTANDTFEPVLRVQVKEVLEHTFQGVTDNDNKLEIMIIDPFEKPLPFERSKNERNELTISLSPVRVGTHWVRISNKDSENFALLPIFAFDDDYVPLSPVVTPSPEEKTMQNQNNNNSTIMDSFLPVRELTTISETSEFSSSRTSSVSSSQLPPLTSLVEDIATNTSSIVSNEFPESYITNGRSTPAIQILDITDLTDPVVHMLSKFNFKDPDDKFNIAIYDVNGDDIFYKTNHLMDGRKCISYEPALVGPVEIHFLKENEPINGSPLIVHAFDPSAVHIINFSEKIQINMMNHFLIDSTNAGKGSLKIIIKDPNNQPLPFTVLKQPNDEIAVQFEPTILGVHIISILFNRIPITETPLQLFVEDIEDQSTLKNYRLAEIEQRGRSFYSKHESLLLARQQERTRSSSPQSMHSQLSKSHDTITSQKHSSSSEPHEEQTTESEDRHQSKIQCVPLNESEIQQFQLLEEKFERRQPIDTVFDPRHYPFKVLLQHPYPIINVDVHLLIDLSYVASVHITINGMKVSVQAARRNNNTLLIQFRPTLAGDYLIILTNDIRQPIPGCPFIFPVYNPDAIHIESFDGLQPINDCHFICNIDKAGQGQFFVMVHGPFKPIRIPIQIQSLSSNRVRISFKPPKIGVYRIYIAYRNIPINGTPIDITVYDIQGISLIAEHSQPVIVRTTVSYKVNTSQAGQGQLKVELIQPQTSIISCRCHIHESNNQEYLIQYIPTEPGRYQLRILFNNQLVQGKTIDTDVYSLLPPPLSPTFSSSSLVRIQQISPNDIPSIGDEICLQIITGKPSVHGLVSYKEMSVPCEIEQTEEKHIWHLKFRPYLVGIYQIIVFHDGSPLMSSPYLIQVKNTNGKNCLSNLTNKPCVIQVHTNSALNSRIRADILLGNLQIPSTMTIVNDNLIRIHFIPQESGLYFISVSNREQPIRGSPFSIRIERPQVAHITAECFHQFRLNDLCIFRVHCHDQRGAINAKIFNLSIDDRQDIGQMISFLLIESYEQLLQFPTQILLTSLTIFLTARLRLTQERIRNLILGKENGHAMVSFQLYETPTQLPTNEQITHVLRNLIDKQTLNIIDPNRDLLHAICGSLVIGPKGEPVDVKLFPQANGNYVGEFRPKKVGQHRIDITFADLPIKGSPFFTEVYDPSQVLIGPIPRDITVGIEHIFKINLDNAGNVPLDIEISSPTGVKVPFKIDDTSYKSKVKKVRFTPTETGTHYLNVKFGSNSIPGTPIKMMVNNARIITVYGDGIHHALHDKPAIFMIDSNDMQGDLKVRIEGPNSVIKNTVERTIDKLFKVTYIPVEVGFVNISIKWNGKDIVNSPFKAIITNPERVRIIGGWQSILDSQNCMHVIINEEKKIHFDISQAGPGTLKADIRDVDNARIPLRIDQQGSLYTLIFTVIQEGKYNLQITYADNSLPNMPIQIIASSVISEPSKIEVYGSGLRKARVNEEAEFIIDTSGAPIYGDNKPIVRLTGVQTDVEVRIQQFDKNSHLFLCSYKPTVPGAYLLSIIWAEQQIRDSPFTVKVLPNTDNDHSTSRVICSGDGLRMGILGKEMQCLIDARAVNPGELTAYCQGINKIAFCRLVDHRDGTYTLFIEPKESGNHILTIKYNGENVLGSPYTVKVSGPSDASKVRVSGPGIEHGILSTFQSHFICQTKGAGAGQLTVKIHGPKGGFRVEMQREHLQDRTIVCRYNPSEPGGYLISVKWSGEHVYGSPFHTRIFKHKKEFDRFQNQLNTYRLTQHQ